MKLVPENCTVLLMHVTKIVRLDWSAAFESFRYKNQNLMQVSGKSFLSLCHPY